MKLKIYHTNQIPAKDLDSRPKSAEASDPQVPGNRPIDHENDETLPPSRASEAEVILSEDVGELPARISRGLQSGMKPEKRSRRLSGFESQDAVADPETLPRRSAQT